MTEPAPQRSAQQQVEQTLLGGERRYNRIQVTEAAGVSLDRARRLVHFACKEHVLPKHVEEDLVMLRDPRLHAHGEQTLRDLAVIMAGRDGAICRELTKLHEEVKRGSVTELAASADALETRGEFVLVIGPRPDGSQFMTIDEVDDLLRDRLLRDSVKDAVAHAVEVSGRPRREIYARALELAKGAHGQD